MNATQDAFPRRSQLWQGAILHTIAHAIFVASNPMLAHELSWDGSNYSRQDSQGSRGTVTFGTDCVVGAFFDEHSFRSPYQQSSDYDWHTLFASAPLDLRTLAEKEALQYVLDEYKGNTMPVITAALWSDGDYLTAPEPWQDVLANGAHLIRIETIQIEDAIEEWTREYEFSFSQSNLLSSLFNKKQGSPGSPIFLDGREQDILWENGEEGIDASYELLAAVGIVAY